MLKALFPDRRVAIAFAYGALELVACAQGSDAPPPDICPSQACSCDVTDACDDECNRCDPECGCRYCDLSKRRGAYLLKYTRISGSCALPHLKCYRAMAVASRKMLPNAAGFRAALALAAK